MPEHKGAGKEVGSTTVESGEAWIGKHASSLVISLLQQWCFPGRLFTSYMNDACTFHSYRTQECHSVLGCHFLTPPSLWKDIELME